jgi:hypothetical protein
MKSTNMEVAVRRLAKDKQRKTRRSEAREWLRHDMGPRDDF